MNLTKTAGALLCAGIFALNAEEAVKASSFGFDAEDATVALQKALDSGAGKVIVDNMGKDWIIRPVFLRSNQEVVIAKDVTVRARRGEFKGFGDSLFNLNDVSNVTLRGEAGAALVMNKKDYDNPALYRHAEWRHCISIRGAERIVIRDLAVKSSGGDGIYIARGAKRPCSRDITIDNVAAEDHYRQGISVISAENVTIKNSKFVKTSGTAPQCGIDFEPNFPKESLSNITIDNCEFNENASAGIMFHISGMNEKSPPLSVTVRNSRIVSNLSGIIVTVKTMKGKLLFENCLVESNRGIPFLLNEKDDQGMEIILKNVTFRNSQSGEAVIALAGGRADMGNITFDNVRIIGGNPPIVFNGMTGYGLTTLSGSLLCGKAPEQLKRFDLAGFVNANRPNPSERNIQIRDVDVKTLVPSTGRTVKGGEQIRIRKAFRFVQSVPGPGEYPIRFTGYKVGKTPFKLQGLLRDPNGAVYDRFTTDRTDYTYPLKIKGGGGIYLVEVNAGGHCLSLHPSGSGQSILADQPVNLFGGLNNRFYFTVPANAEEVAVEATATIMEPVDVQILDAAGKVVKEIRNNKTAALMKVPREKTGKAEVWSIRFPRTTEDYSFRICAPALPLVSAAPENLLIEK